MSLFDIFNVSKIKRENIAFRSYIQSLEAEKNELTQKLSSLEASITPEMKDIIEAKKIIAELSEQKQRNK